jgi:Ca2+-binding RTX toxin-like protein
MRRRIAFSVLLASTVLAWPSPAAAAVTSEVVGGVLRVTGTGQVDVVRIWCDGGDVSINDENPGTGVQACSDLDGIVVEGDAGNDVIYLNQMQPTDFPGVTTIRVNGGAGSDTFHGSPGDDELNGGDDNDWMYASAGSDVLSASTGDDLIIIEAVGDVSLTDTSLVTPDGTAAISGFNDAHLTSTARGGVRFDASGFSGNTVMKTGRGNDWLIGATGRNFMSGSGGADKIVGNDFWDQLFGSDGPDVLLGRGGDDRIDGGRGQDRCRGGPGDNLIYNC